MDGEREKTTNSSETEKKQTNKPPSFCYLFACFKLESNSNKNIENDQVKLKKYRLLLKTSWLTD